MTSRDVSVADGGPKPIGNKKKEFWERNSLQSRRILQLLLMILFGSPAFLTFEQWSSVGASQKMIPREKTRVALKMAPGGHEQCNELSFKKKKNAWFPG